MQPAEKLRFEPLLGRVPNRSWEGFRAVLGRARVSLVPLSPIKLSRASAPEGRLALWLEWGISIAEVSQLAPDQRHKRSKADSGKYEDSRADGWPIQADLWLEWGISTVKFHLYCGVIPKARALTSGPRDLPCNRPWREFPNARR